MSWAKNHHHSPLLCDRWMGPCNVEREFLKNSFFSWLCKIAREKKVASPHFFDRICGNYFHLFDVDGRFGAAFRKVVVDDESEMKKPLFCLASRSLGQITPNNNIAQVFHLTIYYRLFSIQTFMTSHHMHIFLRPFFAAVNIWTRVYCTVLWPEVSLKYQRLADLSTDTFDSKCEPFKCLILYRLLI